MISKKRVGTYSSFLLLICGAGLLLFKLFAPNHKIWVDHVPVVKAIETISVGETFTKSQITTETVPRKFLPPNALLESELGEYVGAETTTRIDSGRFVMTTDLSFEAAEFDDRVLLAADLLDGKSFTLPELAEKLEIDESVIEDELESRKKKAAEKKTPPSCDILRTTIQLGR